MQPSVTCIICTYNRAELLKRAIQSVLDQSLSEWELLVVDDNSTDHTVEAIDQFAASDSRIRYLRNPQKGLPSARNHGIRTAKSGYITFLDDDDVCLPHRFESQLSAMQKSGCAFLVSGYQVRSTLTDEVLSEHKLELKASCAGFPSRWMVRKSLLESIGGFDESYASMEDVECSYRLAEQEAFALHNEIVTVMYATPGSMSSNLKANIIGRIKLMEKHGHIMPPTEAAWWNYTTGLDFYTLGDRKQAAKHFREAAKLDKRGIYGSMYAYFSTTRFMDSAIKTFSLKVLSRFRDFRFPTLVEHPVLE